MNMLKRPLMSPRSAPAKVVSALFGMVLAAPVAAHPGDTILACEGVGITGDRADLRGLAFTVGLDFASVVVRMNGAAAGSYEFTAELRRSFGFTGPVLAATRVTADIPNTPVPYHPVHIDFPTVVVEGPETFTLRFVDVSGPGLLYFETAGIGNFSCVNVIVTNENSVDFPTARTSPPGFMVLAPPVCNDCEGDMNGDRVVDMEDLAILSQRWLTECLPTSLPVFEVTQFGFTRDQAAKFAQALGVQGDILAEDGALRFYSDKFLAVPTKIIAQTPGNEDKLPGVREVIQFDAIQPQVYDPKRALERVQGALREAGLELSPEIIATPAIDHSMFQAVDTNGREIIQAALDTQVTYEFHIGGVPLVGPGAKLKIGFDGGGDPVLIGLLLPAVQKIREYPLKPLEVAQVQARAMLKAQGVNLPRDAKLTTRMVYYAPAPEAGNVQTIQPHYAIGGTIPSPTGGPDRLLRVVLVPALDPRADDDLLPKVELFADIKGDTVFAGTEYWGGNPPYTFSWSSSTTDLSDETGSGVQYVIAPRRGVPIPQAETLVVTLTDASGISVQAEATLPIEPLKITKFTLAGSVGPLVGGVTDVGTEWVGQSQGLGGSKDNAKGFVNRFSNAGVTVRFNWGDFNAWERDFKDPMFPGGDDANWVDNVDAVFYTGHANGDGFTFPGNNNDGFLHYDEARWGQNDVEWIAIAACGPLQLVSGGRQWYQRWGPAFQRLHLLNGYQTITFDNTSEGKKYAQKLLNGKTVKRAWFETGIEVQPATYESGKRIYTATMGVIGEDGETNINDHFWGRGSVGDDIPRSEVRGYWIVWSST